jgi:hypothetical protein
MQRRKSSSVVAFFLATAACATPAPVEQPTNVPVIGVKVERMAWGQLADSWSIGRNGSATHATIDRLGPPPVTETRNTFRISSADFDVLLELLRPAQERISTGVPCDGPMPTDQDTLIVSWSRRGSTSSIWLNSGCSSPTMMLVIGSYYTAVDFLQSREAAKSATAR